MSGINLSTNNSTLKTSLSSLRGVLASSLGERCDYSPIAKMEDIVASIEQKFNDLVLEPTPATPTSVENVTVIAQTDLNFVSTSL